MITKFEGIQLNFLQMTMVHVMNLRWYRIKHQLQRNIEPLPHNILTTTPYILKVKHGLPHSKIIKLVSYRTFIFVCFWWIFLRARHFLIPHIELHMISIESKIGTMDVLRVRHFYLFQIGIFIATTSVTNWPMKTAEVLEPFLAHWLWALGLESPVSMHFTRTEHSHHCVPPGISKSADSRQSITTPHQVAQKHQEPALLWHQRHLAVTSQKITVNYDCLYFISDEVR